MGTQKNRLHNIKTYVKAVGYENIDNSKLKILFI